MTTVYDAADRPLTVTGNLNGQVSNYITQAAYWPQGDVYYFARGNGVWHAAGYNSLLQPTEMYESLNNVNSTAQMLLVSCWNWGSSRNFGGSLYNLCGSNNGSGNNNGSLQGYTMMNGGPGNSQFVTFNQTFSYDKADRLISSSDSGGWSRNFGYDAYGNMWVTGNTGVQLAGNTPTSQGQFTSKNQITGNSYDAAGNLLSVNGNAANYDAENRLVQVTEAPAAGGGIENLAYDGFGRRVEKLVPSAMSVYVYDAFGALAAAYSSSAASAPCRTCYLSTDHLGSVRLVTDQNGIVIARHDYLPFGEEIPGNTAGRSTQSGSTVDVIQKFTGKERDQETGLDFFEARYFSSAQGRFTSPDEPLVDQDPSDPQSWNLYGYVRNNPLRNIDQTGRSCITLDNGSQADDGDGQGCSGAGVSAGNPNDASTLNQGQVNAQATGQQGSWLAAIGTNAFLSASNAANSFFSFIAPDSQLLSQTPTGSGTAATIGAGIGIAATFIGPGGEAEEAAQGASRLWSKGVKNAFQHWIKHGKEFPNLQNAKQYAEAAREFVTNPPPGTLSKLRANGDTVLYNPSTNTFAVKTADGVPRTMFKPNNGSAYFNAQ